MRSAAAVERFSLRQGDRPTDAFAGDVRRGLTSTPKRIQPKYFYDALGSALFAAICELPEYYVTRAEREVLDRHAADIARAFGPVERVIELGSGNARKTERLIDAIFARQQRLLYQPVDVDAGSLEASGRELVMQFPSIAVEAICADYRDIAAAGTVSGRTIVLFLGSSIGNLDHDEATALLCDVKRVLHRGDAMFIGFDLKKSKAVLEPAYDDPLGVTAAFNRNLLARMNRELGANFSLDQFAHRAFFNDREGRIEMHLVSTTRQSVQIDAYNVSFEQGETIHTENSYKYDNAGIEALAAAAGMAIEQRWTDARGWFADVLFRV